MQIKILLQLILFTGILRSDIRRIITIYIKFIATIIDFLYNNRDQYCQILRFWVDEYIHILHFAIFCLIILGVLKQMTDSTLVEQNYIHIALKTLIILLIILLITFLVFKPFLYPTSPLLTSAPNCAIIPEFLRDEEHTFLVNHIGGLHSLQPGWHNTSFGQIHISQRFPGYNIFDGVSLYQRTPPIYSYGIQTPLLYPHVNNDLAHTLYEFYRGGVRTLTPDMLHNPETSSYGMWHYYHLCKYHLGLHPNDNNIYDWAIERLANMGDDIDNISG